MFSYNALLLYHVMWMQYKGMLSRMTCLDHLLRLQYRTLMSVENIACIVNLNENSFFSHHYLFRYIVCTGLNP